MSGAMNAIGTLADKTASYMVGHDDADEKKDANGNNNALAMQLTNWKGLKNAAQMFLPKVETTLLTKSKTRIEAESIVDLTLINQWTKKFKTTIE